MVRLMLVAALIAGSLATRSDAASSSTVVTVTVPSVLWLNPGGCAPGGVDATDFGVVLPGASRVTSIDCDVVFGSNDTSSLRLRQADQRGVGMAMPADGTTDATFGGTRALDAGLVDEWLRGGLEQPDGKLVAYGVHGSPGAPDIVLARFNPDGTTDTSFGGSGTGMRHIAPGIEEWAYDLARLDDGRLLVAGWSVDRFVVYRTMPDGTPDGTWGTGGRVLVDCATWTIDQFLCGDATLVQPYADGRVLVAGTVSDGSAASMDLLLMRLLPTGGLDTSFGTAGTLRVSIGAGEDRPLALRLDEQERIVVTGQSGANAFLTRRLPSGAPDTTLGGTGLLTAPLTATDRLEHGAFTPGGGVALVGSTGAAGSTDTLALRFTSALAPIATSSRIVYAGKPGDDESLGVVVAGTGGLFVSTQTTSGDGILALRPNGPIDPSFGVGGLRLFPGMDGIVGVAGSDGGLWALGEEGNDDLGVTRMGGLLVPDFQLGAADWSVGTGGMFGACLRRADNGASTNGSTWSADVDTDCADDNADPWRSIPTASETVAVAGAGVLAARASLRFGLRVPESQRPGAYAAPITFEVIAPAV